MDKPNIVVTYKVTPEEKTVFLEMLAANASLIFLKEIGPEQREQALRNASGLLSWNFPGEVQPHEYGWLDHVTLLQLVTAGADHIPFAHLPAHIVVASNPGAYALPMAEHVLAMTLALVKRLLPEQQKLKSGVFDDTTLNRSLAGATAGIIGFGGAGRATARLMRAFGMHIYAINQSGSGTEPLQFIGTLNDLEHVLRVSDVVVITLPLTKATRGLLGREQMAWLKPDALLVNVARGAIIDEAALYEHLQANPTCQAGIDTWWREPLRGEAFSLEYPLLDLPNVLGSPHNSALVPEVIIVAAQQAAENIKRAQQGEHIVGIARREDYL